MTTTIVSDSEREQKIGALASTIRLLCPESLIELSFQASGQRLTGYYADKEAAAATAFVYGMEGFECRLTLNPVRTDCTALYRGRLQRPGPGFTARDLHIAHRNWIIFSLRPSSNPQDVQGEPDLMLGEAASVLMSKLTDEGWPDPVIASLPSGCDILYRVKLATKEEPVIRSLFRGAQEFLVGKRVCVEETMCQSWASRPLYGCPHADGRTAHYRNGQIVTVPDRLTEVPRQVLESFAGWAAKLPQQRG